MAKQPEDSRLVRLNVRVNLSSLTRIKKLNEERNRNTRKKESFSETTRDYLDNSIFLSKELRTILQKVFNEYGITGSGFQDQLLAFGEHMLSNNGVGNSEDEEKRFDCNKLCKKAKTCTSNAFEHLGEILAVNCYVGKYPYEYKGHRMCKFMFFARDFPHGAENPHPTCKAKQKDVHVQLPKDRIMRDPQVCWTCYMMRKEERERKEQEKREAMELRKIRYDEFARQPRVNWDAANPY